MQCSPSALSTACLAVISSLGVLFSRAAVARSTTPTLVQGTAFGTGARVSTVTVPLTRPVAQGDLLVGWFGQYNAPEQVQVSDDVNGSWTRAPRSQTFLNDTGDIALYYRENSQAAAGGMTITVSVSAIAYLQGTVADYSGVALAGSLDEIASARPARAPLHPHRPRGPQRSLHPGRPLVVALHRQRRRPHRIP